MASASCRRGCRQTVPPGGPCGSLRSCRRFHKGSISIAISSPDSLSTRIDLRRRDYFRRKPILRIKCCSAGPDESPSGNSVFGASEKIELGVEEVAPYLLSRFEQDQPGSGIPSVTGEAMLTRDFVTLSACVVGLLTGVSVVIFNTAVHEIRDFFWDGLPLRGASWLREEPIEKIWQRVVLVPACGGVIVGMLNSLRSSLKETSGVTSSVKEAMRPLVQAIAASVTLGTANSLGPEGPSVEIGSSIAKGIGQLLGLHGGKSLSLVAAGSAAGISSGFNAAVAGCFFAVESVLWPSTTDSFLSLSNSTSMVILSSVIASVVSEIGLGSEPTFTVPDYDFRSPSELPLYLLLGVLCGIVSAILSGCTSLALAVIDYLQRITGVTKAIFPALGGLIVGLIALSYPEILYWGFENVDILLESRPFVDSLPTHILFQLVGVKIFATSLSRASGLVGGYYAPSLFIGAATGMAYGKFMSSTFCGPNPLIHLSALEVASPQAYGLVGMAATLAGVCQVPLTSVLLLFELTQDYRIVLPLLGAVGISSWITSRTSVKRKAANKLGEVKGNDINVPHRASVPSENQNNNIDLCEIEASLCVYDISTEVSSMAHKLTVSQAMRTKFLTTPMNTSVIEAVTLMQTEKQSCVVVIDGTGFLVGLLLLEEIQSFLKSRTTSDIDTEVNNILVSDICHVEGGKCKTWTATPEMELLAAKYTMDLHGVDHLPVVSQCVDGRESSRLVGLLDRECISIAFRAAAAKGYLSLSSMTRRLES